MILAGDIGGTKTNLAIFKEGSGKLEVVAEQSFISRNYPGLEEVVKEFVGGGGARCDERLLRRRLSGDGREVARCPRKLKVLSAK